MADPRISFLGLPLEIRQKVFRIACKLSGVMRIDGPHDGRPPSTRTVSDPAHAALRKTCMQIARELDATACQDRKLRLTVRKGATLRDVEFVMPKATPLEKIKIIFMKLPKTENSSDIGRAFIDRTMGLSPQDIVVNFPGLKCLDITATWNVWDGSDNQEMELVGFGRECVSANGNKGDVWNEERESHMCSVAIGLV